MNRLDLLISGKHSASGFAHFDLVFFNSITTISILTKDIHVDIDGACGAPVLGQLTLEMTETGEIYLRIYSKKYMKLIR